MKMTPHSNQFIIVIHSFLLGAFESAWQTELL